MKHGKGYGGEDTRKRGIPLHCGDRAAQVPFKKKLRDGRQKKRFYKKL